MWSIPDRTTAGLVAAALLLLGCSGSEAAPPSDVRDIRDPRPDEPGPEPDGDADGGTLRDQLTVADTAFQVDDTLELPTDQQQRLLELVVDAFAYTVDALDTGDHDVEMLRSYYAGGELAGVLAGIERFERDGLRQIGDGTTLDSVRTTAADATSATVHLCITDGPDAGIVDRETGEHIVHLDDPHRLVVFQVQVVEVEAGDLDWRLVASEVTSTASCS